jgi:hypothetical protein
MQKSEAPEAEDPDAVSERAQPQRKSPFAWLFASHRPAVRRH